MFLLNENYELSLGNLEESLAGIEAGNSELILDEATIADVKSLLTERTGAALEQVAISFLNAPKKLLGHTEEVYDLFKTRTEKFKAKIKEKVDRDTIFFRRKAETLEEASGVDDKTVADKIKEYFTAVYEELEYTFKYDKYTLEGFGYAMLTTYVIVLVNSLFAAAVIGVAIAVFGLSQMSASLVGILVTAVLVAPLTEEYAKKFSIENGYAQEFILTFNIAEFALYAKRFGASFGILLARSMAVVFHYATHTVQRRRLNEKDVKNTFMDVGTRNTKVEDENFKTAILSHAAYNSFGAIIISTLMSIMEYVFKALSKMK